MATPGKILVSGANGQLGRELVAMLSATYEVTGFDIDEADICSESDLNRFVGRVRPDLIIHAAAYTAVDDCEVNEEKAMLVNGTGTANIARSAAEIGARLFYYSTDYVFDGLKASAYTEDDPVGPMTVYGRSKLAGETFVSDILEDSLIIRIAWVYGKHGQNFVRTMLKLGAAQIERRRAGKTVAPLRIVNDQFGNPTWTQEIVRQTAKLIDSDLRGIVHATSTDETTWYQFACEIFSCMNMLVDVEPCTSEEFPRPAPRPHRSSLKNSRLQQAGLGVMRDYDIALKECLEKDGDSLCQ